MARNYINEGEVKNFTAAANVKSGDGVVIGALLGVALGDAASGTVGVAGIDGNWLLPKASALAVTDGMQLAWSKSSGQFVAAASAATGDLLNCAIADGDAGAGTTTVRAILCPGSAAIK